MPTRQQGSAPVDRWCWVVCASGFVGMALLDGLMFTFGVIFVDLVEYFGESKSLTALVGSFMIGMSLFFGPVIGVMVHILGFRTVTVLGAIVICLGLTVSTAVPCVQLMIFTYGVIGGVGICMCYISIMLAVSFYFDHHRAIANGIMMSGSGIGTFIYAPMCNLLLSRYGWRGTVLIIGALSLNCAVCGACFRPLKKAVIQLDAGDPEKADDTEKLPHEPKPPIPNIRLNPSPQPSPTRAMRFQHANLPNHVLSHREHYGSRTSCNSLPVSHKIHLDPVVEARNGHLCTESCHGSMELNNIHGANWETELKPLERKDIFYSGSLARLTDINRAPNIASTDKVKIPAPAPREGLKHRLCAGSNAEILLSPLFMLTVLHSCLWTAHFSLLTILPDFAQENGFSSAQSSFLVSILGMCNILGRFTSGFVTNRTRLTALSLNTSALLVGAVTTLSMLWSRGFILLSVEAGIFGMCMGVWTSLRPILLVDLFGLDALTTSLGWLAMFQGVAFTVGPPLIARLYDVSHTYLWPMLALATSFLCSGLCSLALTPLNNCKARRGLT